MEGLQEQIKQQIFDEQNEERRILLNVINTSINNLVNFDQRDKILKIQTIIDHNNILIDRLSKYYSYKNNDNELIPFFKSYTGKKSAPGVYLYTFSQDLQLISATAFDGSVDEKGPYSIDSCAIYLFNQQNLFKFELIRNEWNGGVFKDNSKAILNYEVSSKVANEQYLEFKKSICDVEILEIVKNVDKHFIVHFAENICEIMEWNNELEFLYQCYEVIRKATNMATQSKIKSSCFLEINQIQILEEIKELKRALK